MPKQYREYIKYDERIEKQLAEGRITKKRYEKLKAMHKRELEWARENRQKKMTTESREKMREYMREYIKKYRQNLRAEKRCAYCGRQDEDTLSGRQLCHKCAVKRLGHEPRVLIPREKKPPVGIPRKEWYQYGWCNRCRGPLSKQSSIYLDRPMRVCDKCYEVILEIGRKRTLDAKKRGSKWVKTFLLKMGT